MFSYLVVCCGSLEYTCRVARLTVPHLIILYLRANQGHSGGEHINATLQDNVLLPSDFDTHSIIQSALSPGGKDVKKGRRAVFFEAVKPMYTGLQCTSTIGNYTKTQCIGVI